MKKRTCPRKCFFLQHQADLCEHSAFIKEKTESKSQEKLWCYSHEFLDFVLAGNYSENKDCELDEERKLLC